MFIDDLNQNKILNLKKKCNVIFRNYQKMVSLDALKNFNKICKSKKIKFYLANNIRLAIQANLDGVYIPSFNKSLNMNKFKNYRKKFKILASAHNITELKFKEKQGADMIFLSPLFLTKNYKKSLGIIKFNLISSLSKKPIIALGGIRDYNLSKIKLTKVIGFSGITYFNL